MVLFDELGATLVDEFSSNLLDEASVSAMPLIVETGAGLANAESYISVADFKAYWLRNYAVSAPTTDEAIEQALRRATRYIDGRYRDRFTGWRTTAVTQALEWPREGVSLYAPAGWGQYWGGFASSGYGYSSGVVLGNAVIPQQLKDATAEAAIRELTSPGSLTPDQVPSKRVLRQAVGPISTEYANTTDTRPIVTLIDELLAPLLSRQSALSGSLARA